jgi:hypothetical protein
MYAHANASHSVFDEGTKNFAEAIAEQFRLPAEEALRRINAELAANPMTRGIRLDLRCLSEPGVTDR